MRDDRAKAATTHNPPIISVSLQPTVLTNIDDIGAVKYNNNLFIENCNSRNNQYLPSCLSTIDLINGDHILFNIFVAHEGFSGLYI